MRITSIFEIENIKKRQLRARNFECFLGIKLDCPLWGVSSFFPQVALSPSLFASTVGVVMWFPLQISERNKTRKGEGEKLRRRRKEKSEDRTNPGKMTNNGTFLHAKLCLNGCSWNWNWGFYFLSFCAYIHLLTQCIIPPNHDLADHNKSLRNSMWLAQLVENPTLDTYLFCIWILYVRC